MRLVPESHKAEMPNHEQPEADNYNRLFIIVGLIVLATAVVAVKDIRQGTFLWKNAMINFMAGFFLVFSGFKLMDIKGFA